MGEGIEFIGKVEEAWVPSSVFGSVPGALAAPMVVALWAQMFEASKLVLFVRKQTKRSARLEINQESGSKNHRQFILGNH